MREVRFPDFCFYSPKIAALLGYLYTFTEQLLLSLEHLPGDDKTSVGFIAVDQSIHFFQFRQNLPPKQLIVDDYDGVFFLVFFPVRVVLLLFFVFESSFCYKFCELCSETKINVILISKFVSDPFLPVNEGLLVNLKQNMEVLIILFLLFY